MLRSVPVMSSARIAPDSGRRQRGENCQRMDEALVKNAEDDVDGDQRGKDEVGLVLERLLEGLRGALECGVDRSGHADLALGFFKSGHGVAKGDIGREIEGERDRRILALDD